MSAFNEKTIFLICFFTVFFRMQIYEAIAAIFWQSASYVVFLKIFSLTFMMFEVKLEL